MNDIEELKSDLELLAVCGQIAEIVCKTNLVPVQYRNKPEDGAVAIFWGRTLGLNATSSLQNIAVINGVPSLWGDALVALVKSSPICEYLISEYDEEEHVATVRTKREGEPEEIRRFSWDDAVIAGLSGKDIYKKHPKRMLHARARSHLLRDVYPDVLKGFQIREVIEEDNEVYGLDKEVQSESETLRSLSAPVDQSLEGLIERAQKEEMEDIRQSIRAMDDGLEKERMKTLWKMRREELCAE